MKLQPIIGDDVGQAIPTNLKSYSKLCYEAQIIHLH